MPTIHGGFSTTDPDALEKIAKACGNDNKGVLPFEAKGWKSEKNSHLVKEPKVIEAKVVKKKAVKKSKAAKKSVKKPKRSK